MAKGAATHSFQFDLSRKSLKNIKTEHGSEY